MADKSAEAQIKEMKQEIGQLKKEASDRQWDLKKTSDTMKTLFKDLQRKNQELEKLYHIKDELMNTVSHELRTPLAISQEAMSLVLDGIPGSINDRQKKYLKISHDNLLRLNTIINDFLDVSKLKAGKNTLRRGLVNFNELLVNLSDNYQKVLSSKNQTLKVELPTDALYLYIDGDKIIQVVTNLLNNAHKFTPEDGLIKLDLKVRDSDITCSIQDNGAGIKKKDMPKLFGEFEQFHRTEGPGLKGTGLGLSICKSLVELHEGKIWAESEEGKGTTFFFTLPNHKKIQSDFDHQIEEILKSEGSQNTGAFFVIRLDHFDVIKDKYGESTVMNAIKKILALLANTFSRPLDKFVLYDFRTIYAILPGTNQTDTVSVVDRLKEIIKKCDFEFPDNGKLELRFGVAVYPDEAQDREGLIQEAFKKI